MADEKPEVTADDEKPPVVGDDDRPITASGSSSEVTIRIPDPTAAITTAPPRISIVEEDRAYQRIRVHIGPADNESPAPKLDGKDWVWDITDTTFTVRIE